MAAALPDFNFIAPVYDRLAKVVFGQAQFQAQTHFLPRIPAGAQILILGGGSGALFSTLLQKAQPAHVLFVEASEKMLEKARQRYQKLNATCLVDFRLGTEKDILPSEKFHVILTPFVLDLYPEEVVKTMIHRLAGTLLTSGQWLHTDFILSAEPSKKWWQATMLWAMYRFFRTVSDVPARHLPPFQAHFQNVGFQETASALFFHGFIKAWVWQR